MPGNFITCCAVFGNCCVVLCRRILMLCWLEIMLRLATVFFIVLQMHCFATMLCFAFALVLVVLCSFVTVPCCVTTVLPYFVAVRCCFATFLS